MKQTIRWLLAVCAFPATLWPHPSLSQTKQPKTFDIGQYVPAETVKPKPKKPAAPMSDLDRLYGKYKTAKQITIFSAGDEVLANVEIQYNDAGKPQAIILSGESWNLRLLQGIKDDLVQQKDRAGYKWSGNSSMFEGDLYRKGTQYAKYLVIDNTPTSWLLDTGKVSQKQIPHSFRFEVGDTKRQGNGTTETFSF